ncbi:bleomycin resistance protein [Halomonas binhaiensis]|uniref:Bleomycin resistance protein n=1 Tax=Halomonas binhaiensis TaxID=2562282 RepID=A0A856QVR6_9GAMM|nr:VOC family protein [Halomonas binhaiensis]QEM83949.2 VOC family protein [Halomonas binhaiensis]
MTPNMLSTIPVLQVENAARSCDFYCGRLGFEKDWEHQFEPGMPWFVSVSRGEVTLFLTEHPESAAGALVYLIVEAVDALAQEFQANKVMLEQEPVTQPWGMREMQLKDPDGNRLRFGQDMEDGEV